MNTLITSPPASTSDSNDGLTIQPGQELVVASPDYLVDVGGHGLAYPVLTIQRGEGHSDASHALYPTWVTWILPNGRPAGQVRMDLVAVDGRFASLVKRHPTLAPWASALVTGARRAPALCKAAFQTWEAEASALTLVGRVRFTEIADGVPAEDVYQSMLARAMNMVAEVIEGETAGRTRVRFTVQDCDEASQDIEERTSAGHSARDRRRVHFMQLGLVPAQHVDPARLGVDDDFDGDHPEVFLVPMNHPLVYPVDEPSKALPNPLNLVEGKALTAVTEARHHMALAPSVVATPTVLMTQLSPGAGADSQIQVHWMCEGETVASVSVRLYEAGDALEQVLHRHPEAADWMSTIAAPSPGGDGTIALRDSIRSAWARTRPCQMGLIGRVSLVELDRDIYRPKVVLDAILLSMRVIRDVIAERTFHQRQVNFTIDPSVILSPEEGHIGSPEHAHTIEIAQRFAAAGFVECSPHVQGLFRPRSLQVRLERAPVFAVPHAHPALAAAGTRILH